MIKPILLAAAFALAIELADAQVLTMPPEIQKAYDNGTRSSDGKPGKNYWQNRGLYEITLWVAPPSRVIRGVERIVYANNSPDTLRALNMKLIQNVHRGGRRFGAGDTSAGIRVDRLLIANGT